jgi:hypothetical protein
VVVQKINNGVLYGVLADTKPTNYADNTLFFEQDTGSIYRSTSGSWSIIVGPTKTETLTNKTTSIRDNSLRFLAQSFMNLNSKRFSVVYPAGTGGNQFLGHTGSMTITGTYSAIAYNTTDGQIGANYLTAGGDGTFGGFQSAVSTQWSDNPRFKLSMKVDSTATGRLYAGWSTLSTFPKTDTPFGTSDKGIAFGYRTTDTNFTIFHNDGGGGTMVADAMSTPVAKTSAATKFTVEIICSTSSAQVIYNDTNSTTISADLPTTTDQLAFFCGCISSSATARNWKFYSLDGENM